MESESLGAESWVEAVLAEAEAGAWGPQPAASVEELRGRVVLPCPVEAYRDGGVVERVVEPAGVELLEQAIVLGATLSAEWRGRPVAEAWLVLSGDPRVLEIKEQLRTWVGLHVVNRVARRRRLQRHGSQALFEPMVVFDEVWSELGPWLSGLFGHTDRVEGVIGLDLVRQHQWECTRHTVLDALEQHVGSPDHLVTVERARRLLRPEEEFHQALRESLALLPDPAPGSVRTYVPDELDCIVAELRGLRASLVGRPELRGVVHELCPGVWLSWAWWGAGFLGVVGLSTSREPLLSGIDVHEGAVWIDVDHRGRLVAREQGWIHALELDRHAMASRLEADALPCDVPTLLARLNLEVLRAVRRSQEALARLPCRSREEDPSAKRGPGLGGDADPGDASFPSRTDLRPLRLSTLLRVLAEHFDVSHRSCQGSEILLQKEGCPSYTMGAHKRNGTVGISHIYRLVRVFGITRDQWLAATG